jgi:hypothetical protein
VGGEFSRLFKIIGILAFMVAALAVVTALQSNR